MDTKTVTKSSATLSTFNWNLCIFCQRVSRERIICPGLSKRSDVGSGHKSLSEAFEGFKEVGSLPHGVHFNLWDEGDGVENTCIGYNAGWHKQCRNLLHPTALDRLLTLSSKIFIYCTGDNFISSKSLEMSHLDVKSHAKLFEFCFRFSHCGYIRCWSAVFPDSKYEIFCLFFKNDQCYANRRNYNALGLINSTGLSQVKSKSNIVYCIED